MMRRVLSAILAACAILAAGGAAHGARLYTITQSPAAGVQYDMRSIQSVSFTIANTATGANAGERIYEVRLRINSGSTFAGATAAPAGWTRTAFSTTSVTFRATSWANAIAVGGSLAFLPSITMRSAAANVNESLQDIRARFTTTAGGPPFTNLGGVTTGTPGGWTLVALSITTFQITDLAGTPVTAITAGTSFRLVMTVRNNSTVTQNNVVSLPNPPTATKTGTVTQVLTGTVGSPLNLAVLASGTITFTFSTAAADNGTIFFTAIARNAATVTSASRTSGTLSVGRFTASVAAAPACQYVGSNITITLTLTDGYPYSILNVTPTLTPVAGSPVTYLSGPVPAAPIANVPASPPTTAVTWTYLINATGATNPFTFNGSATGTGNTGGSPVLTTPTSTSAWVSRGSFTASISPTVVNAGSTNMELTVSVGNSGCAAVTSVGITPPAGWAGAGDTYSLVDLAPGNSIESWIAAGGAAVTFTAPSVATQMPLASGGDFAVVYASTPPAATASVFIIRVTDANGLFADIPLTVTVNAFKSGTLNDAAGRAWREEFR